MTTRYAAAAFVSATLAFASNGCSKEGCVGGDDGACVPPTACAAIRYPDTCGVRPTYARLAGPSGLKGPKARGTTDDILLENGVIRAVVDAPSRASGLAPTGGSIIDLALAGDDGGDQVNQFYQAAGLLPRDAVHYESSTPEMDERHAAVVLRGHLEADSRVTVVTRYELRACEPGVRVRSDLYNGSKDPNTLYLADGMFWGDTNMVPFVPGVGLGFRAPELDLRAIGDAWREWPFVAARPQAPPDVSYAVVPCDHDQAAGFNNPTLTAAGVPLATTLPGDGIHFERFILAARGPDLAGAVGEALRVRAMVHGEPAPVNVTGRVVAGGTPIQSGSGRAASLLFYEPAFGPDPDDPARRTPWTEAVPGANGRFTVTLPPGRSYRVQPYAFGLTAAPPTSFAVGQADVDLGDISLAASAHLTATVVTEPGQAPQTAPFAELVMVPVNARAAGQAVPSMYGLFAGCEPMLGPPHGASPACNRAVSRDGSFNLLIPPGHYYVYATRGPFATIDRAEITVGPGAEARLPSLVVESLRVLPKGALSGDFHVHGAASFDSAIPDQDRVVSFLAAGVDVVVATDHDVVTTYEDTLKILTPERGLLAVISGTELTPNIPWFAVPGNDLPTTVGHFNFWPLQPNPALPRNGAPWDELREPGQMMDDVDALFTGVMGVRQLNHPFSEAKLGRDQGFLRAIGYDPRVAIVPGASFAADVLLSAPGGPGRHTNLDWDVQEVMTGASVENWLRYRALWFSLLSQGIVRAGAANSDTHSLGLEQAGYPRNVVLGDHRRDALDVERFDTDVRHGHMQGTNGPVLDVKIEDQGTVYFPGLDPMPGSESAQLSIAVTAAPWVPVEEIRIIVNGAVKKTIPVTPAADHFAAQALTIGPPDLPPIPLLPLLADGGAPARDSWLIVEAGRKLPNAPDVDGDGLPDLAPADVPRRSEGDPSFDYLAIVPGALPVAFTNPFLINVDGGAWQAPGLP